MEPLYPPLGPDLERRHPVYGHAVVEMLLAQIRAIRCPCASVADRSFLAIVEFARLLMESVVWIESVICHEYNVVFCIGEVKESFPPRPGKTYAVHPRTG